jgi:uncharacterized protein (DUF2267 family)
MPASSYTDTIKRLRHLTNFPDDAAAIEALRIPLEVTARMLNRDQLEALADALPDEVAQILREAQPWTQGAAPDFFFGVAVAEMLAPAARARLARDLP